MQGKKGTRGEDLGRKLKRLRPSSTSSLKATDNYSSCGSGLPTSKDRNATGQRLVGRELRQGDQSQIFFGIESQSEKSLNGSRFIDCPICHRTMPKSLVVAHAEECSESICVSSTISKSQDKETGKSQVNESTAIPEDAKEMKTSCDIPEKTAAGRKQDAFSLLMENAMIGSRIEYFACRFQRTKETKMHLHATWTSTENFVASDKWQASIGLNKAVNFLDCNNRKFRGSEVKLCSELVSLDEDKFGAALVDAVNAFPIFRRAFKPYLACWGSGQKATRLSPGMLKSLLQKSIRRNLSCGAVFLAIELMLLREKSGRLDLQTFFRRFPIIIIEDTILHPQFDLLVWLMLATARKYIPGRELLTKCLWIVFEIASVGIKDIVDLGDANKDVSKITGEDLNILHSFSLKLRKKPMSLVWALLTRATFGGMSGDVRMLRERMKTWCSRFTEEEDSGDQLVAQLSTLFENDSRRVLQTLENAVGIQIPLAGVDFHCAPWIVDFLQKGTSHQYTAQEIRSAMWHFHSSKNPRKSVNVVSLTNGSLNLMQSTECYPSEEDESSLVDLEGVWKSIEEALLKICRRTLLERLPHPNTLSLI